MMVILIVMAKVWVWLILLHLEGTEKPITHSSVPGLRITLQSHELIAWKCWTFVRGIFFEETQELTQIKEQRNKTLFFFQGLVWEVSCIWRTFVYGLYIFVTYQSPTPKKVRSNLCRSRRTYGPNYFCRRRAMNFKSFWSHRSWEGEVGVGCSQL